MDDMQNPGDFGKLVNSLGGGGDIGQMFPASDAADLQAGATDIPFAVTDARRNGKKVVFVHEGKREEWYWLMPDGSRIVHG